MRRHATAGFTLIELLIVIAIIGMGAAMISATTFKRDERRALVQGAATELAGTLRQARAYAMDRNIIAAVSFNIANAPGSSGWTLNNRAGGHWYQIVGAGQTRIGEDSGLGIQEVQAGHFPFPQRSTSGSFGGGDAVDKAIRYHLEAMDSAWYGDRHVLPKAKVRFLAIGDQDNGLRYQSTGLYQPAGSDYFYPRPWFGRWDEAGKRLYPWGGYQPQFKDTIDSSPTRTYADGVTKVSPTAFFYEGKDGPISGCQHPSDRLVFDDSDGNVSVTQAAEMSASASRFLLWRSGDPRALIDAALLDLYLVFYPDGTVAFGLPMTVRRLWGNWKSASMRCYGDGEALVKASGNGNGLSESGNRVQLIGPGDRVSSRPLVNGQFSPDDQYMFEVTNYLKHTGAFYITLGPDAGADADADQGRFPSVEKAIDSMMPMFRVYVKPGGDIGWFEVKKYAPTGTTLAWEPAVSAASWQDATFLTQNYPDGTLRNADFSIRGLPVTNILVPEMLRNANWWLQ
jgi:type II secretion system protein H